jgi:regulator of protease activity HflC (stomatin/prohibitin superfamily)
MIGLKYVLMASGIALLLGSTVWVVVRVLVRMRSPERAKAWRGPIVAATVGLAVALLGSALVVVPSGRAGVRVSQLWGTRAGTLYPGTHLVRPIVEDVALYDIRDRLLSTGGSEDARPKDGVLTAQSREGLTIGLAVSVRYRLDPGRLDHVHANLPQPVEIELVPPVVASVFRQLVPNYMVREVFATRREELRQKAAEEITNRLAPDAVVVKEVMLRDVVLPPEYARGLEGLLLRQQENERMVYDLEIKAKEVKSAELEAEAAKAREVKAAEAAAQVRVLQAKAEADAMQHTLPLKEKQIQQTRLEAEARKEATLRNAEAAAQAKVIDSEAEVKRSHLMAGAEAHRIRTTASAEAERMKLESDILRENPLLIQKIVAERLSDKMQIMMVPMDGRDFFANPIFRSTLAGVPAESEPRERSRQAASRR